MRSEIMELEKILNQEIEAYSKLEKYILDKKDSLIKGDINRLKYIDTELEKFGPVVEKLEARKNEISSKYNNPNSALKEIINNAEKSEATRISSLRKKLKNIIDNIQRQNKINAQLIEHSLKLIEHSITTIANFLVPESSAYNKFGKTKYNQNSASISSITHEI